MIMYICSRIYNCYLYIQLVEKEEKGEKRVVRVEEAAELVLVDNFHILEKHIDYRNFYTTRTFEQLYQICSVANY